MSDCHRATVLHRAISALKQTIAFTILVVAVSAPKAEVTTQIKRIEHSKDIARKVKDKRFAELESEANRAMLNKERADDGQWKLAAFYKDIESSVAKISENPPAGDRLEKELLQFANQKKNSSNAWLMYTAALNARAWKIRGNGFRNTVTPEGWKGFKKYITLAKSTLDDHMEISAKNPEWYAYRMRISMYAGEPDDRFEALFSKGVKLEPAYHELFFVKMTRLLPQWGGSTDAMIRFTEEAVEQSKGGDGASIYARLTWYAYANGYREVEESKTLNWSLMKKSFSDVLSSYPSDWNAQKFFFMACSRPDKAEAKRILKYIKEGPSETLFEDNLPVYQMCVDWANGKLPAFAMRNHETGAIKLIE